jgi:hypothetical protein
MHKGLLLVMLAFLTCDAFTQDIRAENVRYYPAKVKYQKIEHDATIFELPYPKDQVESGMKKMAEERGVKVKERNGFYEARNVTILKLNGRVCDMYYKVEKDGKSASKVYMILADPGEDLNNRSTSHTGLLAAAGGAAIVTAVGGSLSDHDHDLRVKLQEDDIKDSEKKYNNLLEDQKRLEKKMTDLQKELDKNKTDQARMQQEIESRKAALEVFKQGKGKGKVEVPK